MREVAAALTGVFTCKIRDSEDGILMCGVYC